MPPSWQCSPRRSGQACPTAAFSLEDAWTVGPPAQGSGTGRRLPCHEAFAGCLPELRRPCERGTGGDSDCVAIQGIRVFVSSSDARTGRTMGRMPVRDAATVDAGATCPAWRHSPQGSNSVRLRYGPVDLPPLVGVIEEEFGAAYHQEHVRKLLHNMGSSVQCPRRYWARADASEQGRWHPGTNPDLK